MCGDSAAGLRRQVGLLLAVVAIALSLLAMHQLSSNHTVAGTGAPWDAAGGVESVAVTGVESHHLADGHWHPAATEGRSSAGSDCPGCADHRAMVLTCLAALILLVVGWVLVQPFAWRGVRLRRLMRPPTTTPRTWTPPTLSLAELSVSRT